MELSKINHFAKLNEFIKFFNESLQSQEEKLRKLSIEYDEELYPHLMSAIAERRYSLFILLPLAFLGISLSCHLMGILCL